MNLRTFGGSDGDVRMVVSSADAAAGSSRTRATSKSIRGSLSELHVVMFADSSASITVPIYMVIIIKIAAKYCTGCGTSFVTFYLFQILKSIFIY